MFLLRPKIMSNHHVQPLKTRITIGTETTDRKQSPLQFNIHLPGWVAKKYYHHHIRRVGEKFIMRIIATLKEQLTSHMHVGKSQWIFCLLVNITLPDQLVSHLIEMSLVMVWQLVSWPRSQNNQPYNNRYDMVIDRQFVTPNTFHSIATKLGL